MDISLIAPCGMNCALCLAYQRDQDHCPGCRDDSVPKPKIRLRCVIKNCEKRLQNGWLNCSRCERPCARLKQLDARYRAQHDVSLLENLACIRDNGIKTFLAQQSRQYTCRTCGGAICVHHGKCMQCEP
jgi:hypothetical protein